MENQGPGTRILVPLDGSELAERALPAAQQVARAIGGGLLLVHVLSPPPWPIPIGDAPIPPEVHRQLTEGEELAAGAYLDGLAATLRTQNLVVQTLVARGDPAATLLDLEPELRVGLVVMSTHGRTGLARLAVGSVADRLSRYGRVPVVLIRPLTGRTHGHVLERALVPLDGSPLAESAQAVALHLAGRLLRHITLLRVVPRGAGPGETARAFDYLEDRAAHLGRRLAGRACTLSIAVVAGDPAECIIRRSDADDGLVIMATRTATPGQRWALGSVADQVLHEAQVPLLLLRSSQAEGARAAGVEGAVSGNDD